MRVDKSTGKGTSSMDKFMARSLLLIPFSNFNFYICPQMLSVLNYTFFLLLLKKRRRKSSTQAVKTTPHIIKEKKATLVPSTVKLINQQTKKAQRGPTENQKEERVTKEKFSLPASLSCFSDIEVVMLFSNHEVAMTNLGTHQGIPTGGLLMAF
jgi:hypothetical protein